MSSLIAEYLAFFPIFHLSTHDRKTKNIIALFQNFSFLTFSNWFQFRFLTCFEVKKTNGQRDKIATLRVGHWDSPETLKKISEFIELIEFIEAYNSNLSS